MKVDSGHVLVTKNGETFCGLCLIRDEAELGNPCPQRRYPLEGPPPALVTEPARPSEAAPAHRWVQASKRARRCERCGFWEAPQTPPCTQYTAEETALRRAAQIEECDEILSAWINMPRLDFYPWLEERARRLRAEGEG